MGRKSKRLYASEKITEKIPAAVGYYKAGIYARLSVNKEEKNESIAVQVKIAEEFIKEWNRKHAEKIEIADCYRDLGKTGTSFERDGFKRLMQDVRSGDINCIIVKDLSRFGRNYLEAGSYIEKIFPFLGVRFIAVADGYDTGAEGGNTGQITTEIKNLINDMYAKDSSVKTRASFIQRREEGSYVGGPPPYGYTAVMEGKRRRLVPDKKTAEIVRYIFLKFTEAQSYKAVADDLNRQRINPPSIYRKGGEVTCPAGLPFKGWDKAYMAVLLKNEAYAGRPVYVREPLIEEAVFERVRTICQKIRGRQEGYRHWAAEYPIGENVFEKVLFCGVCGRKMTRHSHVREYADGSRKRVEEYFCQNSVSTKTEICPARNFIVKSRLEEILFSVLETELSAALRQRNEYELKGREIIDLRKRELERELHSVRQKLKEADRRRSEAYQAYCMGRLSRKEWEAGRRERERKRQELLLHEAEIQKKTESFLKAAGEHIRLKDSIDIWIDKICVYPGKRVEAVFAYRDVWGGRG